MSSARRNLEAGFVAYERRDYTAALKEFTLAADQGVKEARYGLGLLYANGEGVPQDYEQAHKWWRLAAEQGDARAQYFLGWLYYEGHSVSRNYEEARQWWFLAAEQAYPVAEYALGSLYREGKGVPQDGKEAVRRYKLAAEQGYALAQSLLGRMYAEGQGVEQDYKEAKQWWLRAAQQGDMYAQHYLGIMYEEGHGVSQDLLKAVKWYKLAALQGGKEAAKKLDSLLPQMKPEQVAEAEHLVQEWQERRRRAREDESGENISNGAVRFLRSFVRRYWLAAAQSIFVAGLVLIFAELFSVHVPPNMPEGLIIGALLMYLASEKILGSPSTVVDKAFDYFMIYIFSFFVLRDQIKRAFPLGPSVAIMTAVFLVLTVLIIYQVQLFRARVSEKKQARRISLLGLLAIVCTGMVLFVSYSMLWRR